MSRNKNNNYTLVEKNLSKEYTVRYINPIKVAINFIKVTALYCCNNKNKINKQF